MSSTTNEIEQLPSSSQLNASNTPNPAPNQSRSPSEEPSHAPSKRSVSNDTTFTIFTEDLFRYDPLSPESAFMHEAPYDDTDFPYGDPTDAIDVELAAFEKFVAEFEDLKKWQHENSYAYLHERGRAELEGSSSPSANTGQQPKVTPIEVTRQMVHTQDGVNRQVQRLLNAAWGAPKPPEPEPSIFRNLEPYDTYGYPPECFYINPPPKDKKTARVRARRGRPKRKS